MQCTSDFDLEELESRLYSQVFHSTEDWESDPVTPNMILNDMSNRQVSNYAIHNVTLPNTARYWCAQDSVKIPLPPVKPRVPYSHAEHKRGNETGGPIRMNKKQKRLLAKHQKKLDRKREKIQAKQMNSIRTINSATTDNDKCFNNNASNFAETNEETSTGSLFTSGMFADDSIIYQRIDVPSDNHQLIAVETRVSDLTAVQPCVSDTRVTVNDKHSNIIVLSDSDSDSVMEIPLAVPPIYTIDSSNDSDAIVCSSKDQLITILSVEASSVLASHKIVQNYTSDDKNVSDKLKTASPLVKDASENNKMVNIEQEDQEMNEDISIMEKIKKSNDTSNTKTAAEITEEERNEFLHTPDSNTNDFIEDDVDTMNKSTRTFNFMLHGSDLDLSNKNAEKLNRSSGAPLTDIYETESSCSEAGTITSKTPVFHEIDFESPTKEIFCEPDLVSFSNFITPIRKNKPSSDSANVNSSLILTQVKTKALSAIESNCKKPTKKIENKDDDANESHDNPCNDSDEYNSDATSLLVKKKSKKRKKKSKKNKDKLSCVVNDETEVLESAKFDAFLIGESLASINENDNKSAESEKTKKSSSKSATNDKATNKSEIEDNSDGNKNKKQLKSRDIGSYAQDKEMRMQNEDKINENGKNDKIEKNKNKKLKKLTARDIRGNSQNSEMKIVTDTEEQTSKSQLSSKSENEFSFVKALGVIDNKNKEEKATNVEDKGKSEELDKKNDDKINDKGKNDNNEKGKNKRQKKIANRDIPENSQNSEMRIVTDTEEQTSKSHLSSRSENEFSFVKALGVIDNKNKEGKATNDETKDKSEELDKNEEQDNNTKIDSNSGQWNLKVETSSADNEGFTQFSFVGAWNKLNTEITEKIPVGLASGLNMNKSTDQNKLTTFNPNQSSAQNESVGFRTAQAESTGFNMSKSTEGDKLSASIFKKSTEQYKSPIFNVNPNNAQKIGINNTVRIEWDKASGSNKGTDHCKSESNKNINNDQENSYESNMNKNAEQDKSFGANLNKRIDEKKSSGPSLNKSTSQESPVTLSIKSSDQVKSPGPSLNKSIVQEKPPTPSLKRSDQVKSPDPSPNKSIKLSEYISLNLNENTEPFEIPKSYKKLQNMITDSNELILCPDKPLLSKNNSSSIDQTVVSNSPSTSKELKKCGRASDVIILSSDSGSDMELSPTFNFYKDTDKNVEYTEHIVVNTSTPSELDTSNLNISGPSSTNIVVNPFSVKKIKKSFKDFWTSDMKMFYDESWGQENYDLQKELSSMPSDKSNWKIILEDQRPNRSPRKRGPVCLRCREPGHLQYRCPRYTGPIKCSTCGGAGHSHTRCPNLMCTTCGNKGGYHTTSCYKCAHYGRIKCTLCNMFGHLNTDCPDMWRRYHLTTQDTQKLCSPDIPCLKPVHKRWCSNCARRGHFQDSCSYSNFEHFLTNNRIISYAPMYNCDFDLRPQAEETIPMLQQATLSDIRNYKHTVMADNNKKYENIVKTLKRQCLKSNLQYLDQLDRLEKSIKSNQISRKHIGHIYKIRSLIQKHSKVE